LSVKACRNTPGLKLFPLLTDRPTALSVKIRSVVASEEGKAGGGKEESKGTGAAGDPETVLARRRREEDGETEDRRRPGGMRDGINGAGHEGRL